MGTWALEFDPGATGSLYKMVLFNGDLFGFCCGGSGGGVWRRTPPNWTQTIASTNVARGCVWDDLMFWGHAGGAGSAGVISSSTDGVNWVVDFDPGAGVYTAWSAMGGYGDYLYAAMRSFQGIAGNTFYRRDTAGNWVATPPVNPDPNYGTDVVGFGNYVYWCDGSDCDRYQAAWEAEPTLDGDCDYFQVHGGTLFAITSQSVHRLVGSAWVEEFALGGAWGFEDVSEGADGNLWLAAYDGADSRVYFRQNGIWTLHSTAPGAWFRSAVAAPDGNLYAGTASCEFWAYTPDFAVSPVGGGLYPQAMDVDGDGNALYLGLYDAAGQPILVKVGLPLVPIALGTAVFNPADGDAINVKCGNVGGHVAISGNFAAAGNEQVEVSDDAGMTWTDIDRDAWGVERAQPILVSPDDLLNEVMVALETAQDITETFDGGATAWVVNNPAVTYSPGAMAKLPGGDELVIGDDAANRIDYSPNRGVTLQNVTGAFAGNVAAIEVA